MAHRTPIVVRFNELDPYGHVNHSVYVTYFEVGRTDALAACGVPLEAMAERGYQLVVTNLEVRFRAPAEAGQTLIVETGLAELRRASGTWHQRVLRPAVDPSVGDGSPPDGLGGGDRVTAGPTTAEEVLVTAAVTAAVTDRRGKPCRPPDWLFPALEKLQTDPD